jgi:ABC-2 type transport system ATP-binding protein
MGMKQRLGIAAALLGEPELLVLDEPTNGLDPGGIHDMRELVRGLASSELTVWLSSHLLSEVEEVCDWITLIDRGRHLYEGPTAGLLARRRELVIRPLNGSDLDHVAALAARLGKSSHIEEGTLVIDAGGTDLDALAVAMNHAAYERGIDLAEIRPVEGQLERSYLELVKGGLG